MFTDPEECLAIKNPDCSYREPSFSDLYLQGGLLSSVTPVAGDLMPSSGLYRHCTCMMLVHGCRQNTRVHLERGSHYGVSKKLGTGEIPRIHRDDPS